jgi:four helix bundle protein
MKEQIRFEDLEIWKEGMRLCVAVYKQMKNCKDYGFKDQIQRAAVSIPSNIAEGFERQTNKEFVQYLFISKGSCGELRTQLYLAKEFQYLDSAFCAEFLSKSAHLSSMIANFIKELKKRI